MRELLQQALDALKNAKSVMGNLTSDECSDCMYIPVTDAIKALEAELAKPEPLQVRPHEFIAMASKQANKQTW